jgi:hypothetical protein
MSTTQVWLLLLVVVVLWTIVNAAVTLVIRQVLLRNAEEVRSILKGAIKANNQRGQVWELQRATMETRLAAIETRLASMAPPPDLATFAEDADDY